MKNIIKSLLLYSVILIFLSSCGGNFPLENYTNYGSSLSTGEITGYAFGDSSVILSAPKFAPARFANPIANASVTVVGADGSSYGTATTASDGKFTVTNLPVTVSKFIIKIQSGNTILRHIIDGVAAGVQKNIGSVNYTTTALTHIIESRINNNAGTSETLGEKITSISALASLSTLILTDEINSFNQSIANDSTANNPVYKVYKTVIAVFTQTSLTLQQFLSNSVNTVNITYGNGQTVSVSSSEINKTSLQDVKLVKSLTVSPSSFTINQGESRNLTITANYTDGTTGNISANDSVVYIVSNTSRGSAAHGVFTATGIGSITLTIRYLGIENNIAITILDPNAVASISISAPSQSVTGSGTIQFTCTGIKNNGQSLDLTSSVIWSIAAGGVGTISDTGTYKGVRNGGTAVVSATYSGSLSSTNQISLTITAATISSITITPSSQITLKVGSTQQFAAVALYNDNSTETITSTAVWNSTNSSAGTFSTSTRGLFSAVGAYTTTVTASINGITSNSVNVTVNQLNLTGIIISTANSTNISVGGSVQFTAIGTYEDASTGTITSQVTWSPAQSSAGSISSSGVLTGSDSGIITVTASLNSITSSNSINVTISDLVAPVITNNTQNSQSLANTAFPVTATITDNTVSIDSAVIFYRISGSLWASSSMSHISQNYTADIPANYITTAGAEYYIKAMDKWGNTSYFGKNGQSSSAPTASAITVTVVDGSAINSIVISVTAQTVTGLGTLQFSATGTTYSGQQQNITFLVNWNKISGVGSISSGGIYTGVRTGGTAVINATYPISNPTLTSNSITITNTAASVSSIIITAASSSTIKPDSTLQFTATASYNDGGPTANITTSVIWSSTNTSVGTITSNGGLFTAKTAGNANVTAETASISSNEITVTVSAWALTGITISSSTNFVNAGSTLQLTATGTYESGSPQNITNSVVWESNNTSRATIGASTGIVTGVSAGDVLITARSGSVSSAPFAITVVAVDNPPTITHTPLTMGVVGIDLPVAAVITDSNSVQSAKLYYRILPSATYIQLDMSVETGVYRAVIPGTEITTTNSIYYYLMATDNAGNNSYYGNSGQVTAVPAANPLQVSVTSIVVAHSKITTAPVNLALNIYVTSNATTVNLYYKKTSAASYTIANMTNSGAFTYTIPSTDVTSEGLRYYILATDGSSTVYYGNDGQASTTPTPISVSCFVLNGPVIQSAYPGVSIFKQNAYAVVSSGVSISSVEIYYKVEGAASFQQAAMTLASGIYTASNCFSGVSGTKYQYYIKATDTNGTSYFGSIGLQQIDQASNPLTYTKP